MDISQLTHDSALCQSLLARLEKSLHAPMRFMEVCGTHTVSLFRSGLRSLLPSGVTHLSGPGCPVCVTHDAEVSAYFELAEQDAVILATFGDLMRVPDSEGRSLKQASAAGAQIEIVYSPLDAVALAKAHPEKKVVFLGVGFETTAPAVAASILAAQAQGRDNFFVLSLHKLVPPVLEALLQDRACAVDAFLLPGHVSTVLGLQPYTFVAQKYKRPAVVGGFEPADMLVALIAMAEQRRKGEFFVQNCYPRAVAFDGNARARAVMAQVFMPTVGRWRGIGEIAASGLALRPEFAAFDAKEQFSLVIGEGKSIPGCQCGAVLQGSLQPDACPLFGRSCTPQNPIGPCMVSAEGSCAAYFSYSL